MHNCTVKYSISKWGLAYSSFFKKKHCIYYIDILTLCILLVFPLFVGFSIGFYMWRTSIGVIRFTCLYVIYDRYLEIYKEV